jgi:hypothetical protein
MQGRKVKPRSSSFRPSLQGPRHKAYKAYTASFTRPLPQHYHDHVLIDEAHSWLMSTSGSLWPRVDYIFLSVANLQLAQPTAHPSISVSIAQPKTERAPPSVSGPQSTGTVRARLRRPILRASAPTPSGPAAAALRVAPTLTGCCLHLKGGEERGGRMPGLAGRPKGRPGAMAHHS